MPTALAASRIRVHPLRCFAWRHPEWPWACLAAGAWIVLLVDEVWPEPSSTPTDSAMAHPMPSGISMESPMGGPHGHQHHDLSSAGLGFWMLMTVAMMVPAALPIIREVSLQSIWTRRYRSPAIFFVGYLSVWGAFGALALGIWTLAAPSLFSVSSAVAGGALFGAAGWSLSMTKRRYLKRCHRYLPLAARGRAADCACLGFGLYHARQCVGVCWPIMLVMVPSHAFVLMLLLATLVTWERLARLPRLRVGGVLLAAAGVIQMVIAA
jgi:predicted metal-binding membrane protein